jgi:hypothetical protein
MVKAPLSHGLDRKFKSWRRGKSQHSTRQGSSRKQQLRGHERLLLRATDETHRQSLMEKIAALKEEMESKQQTEQERKNAKKSHGARFLDRTKLVRMERHVRKSDNLTVAERDAQLTKIALDQVFVAHCPMDCKYMPLFYQGVRRVDSSALLYKRAAIRRRVLEQLAVKTSVKDWISSDQYERIRRIESSWSVHEERAMFGEATLADTPPNAAAGVVPDDRFSTSHLQLDVMLAAAREMDAELDRQEEENGYEKSSSIDDENSSRGTDDEADPLKPRLQQETSHKDSEPDHVSSSSSDDASSVSSSDSSSVDSGDNGQSAVMKTSRTTAATNEEVNNDTRSNVDAMEDDDFLVAATDDDVFKKPKEHVPAIDPTKGDKSRGWATQRQRPGEYKKKQPFKRTQNRRHRGVL